MSDISHSSSIDTFDATFNQMLPQRMEPSLLEQVSNLQAGTEGFDWGSILQEGDFNDLSSLPTTSNFFDGIVGGNEMELLGQDMSQLDRTLESWPFSSNYNPEV